MTQHKSVEAGFTPGPWEFDDSDAERCVVLQPSFMAWHIAYTAGAFERPQEEANAHLIAAAPALYSALERNLDLLTGMVGAFGEPDSHEEREIRQRIDETKAALSSARGNQS